MERISGDGFFSYRRDVAQKKNTRRSGGAREPRLFSSELREIEQASSGFGVSPEVSEAEAAELLDAVFAAGDRLKRHRDTKTLMAYKETVKRFLSTVVRRALDVGEQQSGSNIMRRKRYTLVQVIDTKLEQLAAGMISTQKDQLDLLARVDEINGLLIDLTH